MSSFVGSQPTWNVIFCSWDTLMKEDLPQRVRRALLWAGAWRRSSRNACLHDKHCKHDKHPSPFPVNRVNIVNMQLGCLYGWICNLRESGGFLMTITTARTNHQSTQKSATGTTAANSRQNRLGGAELSFHLRGGKIAHSPLKSSHTGCRNSKPRPPLPLEASRPKVINICLLAWFGRGWPKQDANLPPMFTLFTMFIVFTCAIGTFMDWFRICSKNFNLRLNFP